MGRIIHLAYAYEGPLHSRFADEQLIGGLRREPDREERRREG